MMIMEASTKSNIRIAAVQFNFCFSFSVDVRYNTNLYFQHYNIFLPFMKNYPSRNCACRRSFTHLVSGGTILQTAAYVIIQFCNWGDWYSLAMCIWNETMRVWYTVYRLYDVCFCRLHVSFSFIFVMSPYWRALHTCLVIERFHLVPSMLMHMKTSALLNTIPPRVTICEMENGLVPYFRYYRCKFVNSSQEQLKLFQKDTHLSRQNKQEQQTTTTKALHSDGI